MRNMGHKSPFTDWVFEAWDKLVLSNGAKLSFEERWNGWHDLYGKTYIDGKWVVGLDDASLVASLGQSLAMTKGDFLGARQFCREFIAHPQLDRTQVRFDHAVFYFWEAAADILCGNTEAGISRLRRDLVTCGQERSYLVGFVNSLIGLLNAQGLGNPANPDIAALVDEVVGRFRGQSSLPSETTPSHRTNADLDIALRESFGKPQAS